MPLLQLARTIVPDRLHTRTMLREHTLTDRPLELIIIMLCSDHVSRFESMPSTLITRRARRTDAAAARRMRGRNHATPLFPLRA